MAKDKKPHPNKPTKKAAKDTVELPLDLTANEMPVIKPVLEHEKLNLTPLDNLSEINGNTILSFFKAD